MNIGTAGGFADGVQTPPTETGFQEMHGFEVGTRLAEPFRQAGGRKNSFYGINLDEMVLRHELSFWHARTGAGRAGSFIRIDMA